MDVLTSLMMSAVFRKAAALEQWLVNHRHCDPAPRLRFIDDNSTNFASCSCGASLQVTVVIGIDVKERTKCAA